MTRTVLRNTIRMKLGESTATFWTDAMLNQWINDGQLDIVTRAKLKRTRGTFTTTEDVARYTLSSIFPNLLRILHGGVWIYDSNDSLWHRLEYRTKEDMDVEYEDWPNADSSVPIIYMEDIDEDVLELYPAPQSSCAGTDYCRVYYSSKPTDIGNDATEPDIPRVLDTALIEYVVSTGFETRGYGDLANDHWAKYYDKIKSYLIEKENREDEELIMKSYRG